MSEIMDKLLAEEKEAEQLMYGEQEENPSEEAPSTEEAEVIPESSETESLETEDPAETEQPKPKRTNWKKRFIGYKKSTDEKLAELRGTVHNYELQLSDLQQHIKDLTASYNDLVAKTQSEKDPFDGVFTKEDEDLLGAEALDAMKKAALATKVEQKEDPRIAQLEKKLAMQEAKEAERKKLEAERAQAQSMEELTRKLKELVPNFEQIDTDDAFGAYLNDMDDYSDNIRMDLFQTAVRNGDVAGTARFYKGFMESTNKTSVFDEHIMPTGDGADDSDPSRRVKKMFHISEYNKFMDDYSKGRYRGREKEAQKLEKMYDKAYLEGRIYE